MTRRRRGPVRPRSAPAAAAVAAAGALAGCGAAAPPPVSGPPAWRDTHPDPGNGVRFLDASGVCVITVRYPQDAPGEIVVDMTTFVQHDRLPRPAAPPAGRTVGTSGDWTVVVVGPSEVQLVTADSLFDYRPATC